MFMQPGTVYIYRIYGIHHCFNIVCGNADGQAVLLRAILPTIGIDTIARNRQPAVEAELCNGPAKLFVGLGLETSWNATALQALPIEIIPPAKKPDIKQLQRIGITKNAKALRRYVLCNKLG